MKYLHSIFAILLLFTISCGTAQTKNSTMNTNENKFYSKSDTSKLTVSNDEWKKTLDAETYQIARQKGTEYAFSGKYWNTFDVGTYRCKACGNALFKSDGKFESSCGWPSFFEPISATSINYAPDNSHGMQRTEVMCGRCDAHLGHVFDDGPAPTYKRYCINSVILDFENKETTAEPNVNTIDTATLGGGCFWCIEAQIQLLDGIIKVESGFSGGNTKNPTYKEVCTGLTGHAEVIEITFDSTKISYDELLAAFWKTHDPTQLNRQGNDVGTQYRSAIFYHNEHQKQVAELYKQQLNESHTYSSPIVTEIKPFTTFYKAENYHQNYYNDNKSQGYCQFVIAPKIEKFKKEFKEKIK